MMRLVLGINIDMLDFVVAQILTTLANAPATNLLTNPRRAPRPSPPLLRQRLAPHPSPPLLHANHTIDAGRRMSELFLNSKSDNCKTDKKAHHAQAKGCAHNTCTNANATMTFLLCKLCG